MKYKIVHNSDNNIIIHNYDRDNKVDDGLTVSGENGDGFKDVVER